MARTATNTTAADDSSPKVPADIRKSHPDDVILLVEEGQCHCGCGAKARSNFLPGHDARFKGILQRAHQRGNDVTVYDGTGTVTSSPSALAADRGWEKFIASAEAQMEKRAAAAKQAADRKANSKNGKGRAGNAKAKIQDLDFMREAAKLIKSSKLRDLGISVEATQENSEHIVTLGGVPANVTVRGKTYTGKVVDINKDEGLVYVEYKPARGNAKSVPVKTDDLELVV